MTVKNVFPKRGRRKAENLINQNDVGKTCVRDRMSEKLWESVSVRKHQKQIEKSFLGKAGWCAMAAHGFSCELPHKSNIYAHHSRHLAFSHGPKFTGKFT